MTMSTNWTVRTPPAPQDVEAVEAARSQLSALKSRIEEVGGKFATAAEQDIAALDKWLAEREQVIADGGLVSPSEERNALAKEFNAFAEQVFSMRLASLTQSEGDQ